MTPQEHAQIAEINQQWRNMNRPIDIEEKRRREKEYLALSDNEARGFDFGWDAAVAYLSEPGAMRFLANESITKENDALRKQVAELEAKYSALLIFSASPEGK